MSPLPGGAAEQHTTALAKHPGSESGRPRGMTAECHDQLEHSWPTPRAGAEFSAQQLPMSMRDNVNDM